ncbi:MAG: response regulator [Gemmatimonadales bacterium]
MPDRGVHVRPPVVLIVDDQEWSTRSLESVLAPNGYAVMRAFTAKAGLDRAQAQPPDLIFVSANLPNSDGVEFCRTLRENPNFSASIPILITSSERPSRELRLATLRAGAWEFVSFPIDAQELLLRLDAYVRAKFETDRALERCLVDEPTGLYNLRGLEQRARELRSQAYRDHQALACVVIAPTPQDPHDENSPAIDQTALLAAINRLGRALKDVGRVSDAIGRLGQNEFAIMAPSTDSAGAARLAKRLQALIRDQSGDDQPLQMRAGYDAVKNVRETPVEARDLMLHATIALRKAKSNGNGDWIKPFEIGGRDTSQTS